MTTGHRYDDKMFLTLFKYLISPAIVSAIAWGAFSYYYIPRQEAQATYQRKDMMDQQMRYLSQRLDRIDGNLTEQNRMLLGHITNDERRVQAMCEPEEQGDSINAIKQAANVGPNGDSTGEGIRTHGLGATPN